MKSSDHEREKNTPKPRSARQKAYFHTMSRGNSFLAPQFTPALPVHILLTKTWASSTRNSNLWLETDLDKSELYHTRQAPQVLLRGCSHFKASFHLNTNRVNNWQSMKQIPSSFPFQMARSSSFLLPPPLQLFSSRKRLLSQRDALVEMHLLCEFSEHQKIDWGLHVECKHQQLRMINPHIALLGLFLLW